MFICKIITNTKNVNITCFATTVLTFSITFDKTSVITLSLTHDITTVFTLSITYDKTNCFHTHLNVSQNNRHHTLAYWEKSRCHTLSKLHDNQYLNHSNILQCSRNNNHFKMQQNNHWIITLIYYNKHCCTLTCHKTTAVTVSNLSQNNCCHNWSI